MLWIIDAVQSPPNVIYVHETAGGMAEWVKILITATVGALVGIVSNIAMEYVKPWIAKRSLKETVTNQLISELAVNYHKIESGCRVLEKAKLESEDKQNTAIALSQTILLDIDADRYEYNFVNNKALVYEIDPKNRMTAVYKALKNAKIGAQKLSNLDVSFRMASVQARLFFKENSITVEAKERDLYT